MNPWRGLHNLRLLNITIFSVSLIVILLSFGVAISFAWPASWNSTLSALILNIISSLIGVLAAVLIALFIVERYLEQHRREVAEKEALQERLYNEQWKAYLDGGLAVTSVSITHISLFVAYGREKYLELIGLEGDANEVPTTIAAYISFFYGDMKNQLAKGTRDNEKDGDESKGMDGKEAARLAKAFSELETNEVNCSSKDLIALQCFLKIQHVSAQQKIFLFQPFMIRRMGLGITLQKLDEYLIRVIHDIESLLTEQASQKTSSSIILDKRFTKEYAFLGLEAVKVIQLIWNYAQGTSSDYNIVINRT